MSNKLEVGMKVKVANKNHIDKKVWGEWRGIIIEAKGDYYETKTTSPTASWVIGSTPKFFVDNLELVNDDEFKFIIPENKTACPKCKSFDCKGLSRLECLTTM